MAKPTQSEKAMLVATIAAGIYADSQSWRDFEHEQLEGESWHEYVLRIAKVRAKIIWKDSEHGG